MPRLMPLLLALLLPFPALAGDAPLQSRDAWIREAPPGRTLTAGYVTFVNPGDEKVILVAASALEGAEKVEFHTSERSDGMMRMRRLETVEVPAGGEVAFAPGGHHLMLFGTEAPRAGTVLEAGIRDRRGQAIRRPVPGPSQRPDPRSP
ncbi:MAG: copper chaperone PCu(A)C [Gammaproteobacteria bacterium]|nr:copper chaperone PCu(A)C [Gammaproteobacteria bacterium]